MRDAFARFMTEAAKEREDICLLSGDIGNRMFDEYKKVAPDRFFNCGIAEGNMMSVAAGMGLSGLRPVVYTITPFTTTRCLEQIKIGAAYHDVPVVIVGTGSGLSYAELGPTHHSLEDIGIMRAIPGINILTPVDRVELEAHLHQATRCNGPSYIRIGKKGEPVLNKDTSGLGIGKCKTLREGDDVLILTSGPIASEALLAAERCSGVISACVVNIGSVRPLDNEYLSNAARKYKDWIVLEEHSCLGGLGSIVCEWIAEAKQLDIRLKRMDTGDSFIHCLGSQAYTRRQACIDADAVEAELMFIESRKRQ